MNKEKDKVLESIYSGAAYRERRTLSADTPTRLLSPPPKRLPQTPPTWNDALNAMSAEEKARWIRTFISCECCQLPLCDKDCVEMWADYFNSPYDGGSAGRCGRRAENERVH